MLGTRVTFPSRGKSPKARQGLCPLESPEGDASLPLQHIVLLPPQKGFSHRKRPICHFEMVGKSVFILPFGSFEGTLSTFNPWHGRIDFEDA